MLSGLAFLLGYTAILFALTASDASFACAAAPEHVPGRPREMQYLVVIGAAGAVIFVSLLLALAALPSATYRLTAAFHQPLERNLIFFHAALDAAVASFLQLRARRLRRHFEKSR
ncbi:hypothetical protein [Caldimonas sp. KR1-144]|uniref:hypothetical protein n=1 Tax=Caldimonas sp. KR1-144 TaxID=3400911 RepID=UPI003C0FB90E